MLMQLSPTAITGLRKGSLKKYRTGDFENEGITLEGSHRTGRFYAF